MNKEKILIVEDELIIAKDLESQLTQIGYDVPGIASTGDEAINKADEVNPDLILMDIVLPGDIDGIEAARQIRLKSDIPVIYLSAYTDIMLSERAKDTGAFGYLSKPVSPYDLRNTIKMALYKHQTEKALKKSEERYRLLFNNLVNPIIIYDLNGGILLINNAAAKNLGRPPEDLRGKSIYDLIPETRDIDAERIREIVKSDQGIGNTETHIKLPSGEEKWFLSNYQPVRDENGRIYAVQVISYDITERKNAEVRLRNAANEWEATFNSISDMVSIHDKDFNLVRVNRAFSDMLKKKRSDLIGKKCHQVLHGTDEPWPDCPHVQTMKNKKPFVEEFFEPALGVYLQVSTSPIFDEKGEVVGSVHIAKDISALKKK